MTRHSTVTGYLSIAVMVLLALFLFNKASPMENPVAAVEKAPPDSKTVPTRKMTLAAVTLPPPPVPRVTPTAARKPIKPAPVPALSHDPITPLKTLKPTAQQKQTPEEITPMSEEDRATAEEDGRVLLRLLETGKGPAIEIAWPEDAGDRARLYRVFTRCYGMKTALLDSRYGLYTTQDRPGETWRPNLDRYSTFMRQPQGSLTPAEKRLIKSIRDHHALSQGTPARLFPRAVDATLLANLNKHLKGDYGEGQRITAVYTLKGDRVHVTALTVDGISVPESIALNPRQRCRL